jgi:hypothetical protein
MKKHTNLGDEIFTIEQPKDRSTLYIGIAVGVMITLCGLILVWGLLVEKVMY